MKTNRKAAPSKLVARFDTLLLQVLTEDLKAYRAKQTSTSKASQHLSAA